MRLMILALSLFMVACDKQPQSQEMELQDWLGGIADEGFERATEPRQFTFPEDHNAHPGFRNEWWYVTGNVADKNGYEFGYQVTFFRIGLSPDKPKSDSPWATNQLWMAHIALSDIPKQRHHHQQRLVRQAIGLAGSELEQNFRVWLEDWQIISSKGADFPWKVQIKAQDFVLDLALTKAKPLVLQGQQGLSQKGKQKGNASYYYSYPRMDTSGTIKVNKQSYSVKGLSWFDREWSTSALDDNQVGWDWFALQFDDGNDFMYYQLRQTTGEADVTSSGKWIAGDGSVTEISKDEVYLQPIDYWKNEKGERYPVVWQFEIPTLKKKWLVKARFPEQMMDTGVSYWEGAVEVLDAVSKQRVAKGYLEMTGY
ncbi:MAG: AttH component of AttEFGH ABC transport system [uncultured Thiotrichaceae bacterium]|uniref:AttH component of AttEFGH ABC transport system n=1 Tax=uncultured Thiotrichaceae bacterium TaxID=298394 RepID=A0A6S6T807_9GAMM|nr:MAG: AttH component of AttEFGH ABC transport system [uncultured Thiotrichaceae bacterium]